MASSTPSVQQNNPHGIFSSGSKSFCLDSLPWSARVESIVLDETPDRLTYEAAVRLDASNGWMALVGFVVFLIVELSILHRRPDAALSSSR